jgi:hypothetical protein
MVAQALLVAQGEPAEAVREAAQATLARVVLIALQAVRAVLAGTAVLVASQVQACIPVVALRTHLPDLQVGEAHQA